MKKEGKIMTTDKKATGLMLTDAPAGGGGFKMNPVEGGAYMATIIGVVDLGMQPQQEWDDKKKVFKPKLDKRKGTQVYGRDIKITFLLPTEPEEFEYEDKETKEKKTGIKQRFLSENYKFSSNEKAKIVKLFTSLKLDVKQNSISELLGRSLSAEVIKTDSGSNRIKALTPLMKGMVAPPVPEGLNMVYFDLDHSDAETFMKIPEWIRKTIMSSPSWDESDVAKEVAALEAAELGENKSDLQ